MADLTMWLKHIYILYSKKINKYFDYQHIITINNSINCYIIYDIKKVYKIILVCNLFIYFIYLCAV